MHVFLSDPADPRKRKDLPPKPAPLDVDIAAWEIVDPQTEGVTFMKGAPWKVAYGSIAVGSIAAAAALVALADLGRLMVSGRFREALDRSAQSMALALRAVIVGVLCARWLAFFVHQEGSRGVPRPPSPKPEG
jgi:hypothetical protein